MSRFLGIDLGTQGLDAVIYDAERRAVLGSGYGPLRMFSGTDGAREQVAEWWLEALREALSQIEPALKRSVRALAVSGQQHGFVPLGADGQVLAPVKLWCDTATVRECQEITDRFGGQAKCVEEAGNPILPGYTASKILWLKNHEPERYAQLETILLPHDYLNFHFTGERVMECGDASGTGLFDIRRRNWHLGLLAALDAERDLAHCLPPLIGTGEEAGRLRTTVAEQLGLPAGIPVACGGGDNMMAAIGTGNVTEGCLTISLGTSGTMFAYSDAPGLDPDGELAAFCSSTGGWLPLHCTMNCTVATELARSLFSMSIKQLEQALDDSNPGADGVLALPFYHGERTPNLPSGKGCIVGLDDGNTTPANIARASMEGTVFALRGGLAAFQRTLTTAITEIRVTGGGAASVAWRQAIADNLGLPVKRLDAAQGAALGAALNAMLLNSAAHGDSAALAAEVDEHVKFDEAALAVPNATTAAEYQQHYERYCRYLDQLQPLFA